MTTSNPHKKLPNVGAVVSSPLVAPHPVFLLPSSPEDEKIVDPEGGLILGVDPGLSGAIAVLNPGNPVSRRVVALYDMPVTTSKAGARRVDVRELVAIFECHANHARLLVIEEVAASPQQGVVSAFNFGMGFGMLLGVAAGHWAPVHLVKPSMWKLKYGLSSDKNESRRLAAKIYPAIAAEVSRKKDDGRAEALLLAHVGLTIESARAKSRVGGV